MHVGEAFLISPAAIAAAIAATFIEKLIPAFADPANNLITGQVLYVCGGTSVGSLTL